MKQGDSWARIAGNIYGELFDYDPIKAQRMAEDLARRNNKVRGLTPGTVIRVARPRQNPYVSAEFMGQTAAAANQVAQPGYTGAVQQPQTQGVAPTVNYNAGSYQGRPWATGSVQPVQTPGVLKTMQGKSYGKSAELPWNPNAGSLLFGSNGQPRPQVLPGYSANASTWENPNKNIAPIQGYTLDTQPAAQPNASTWNNPNAPAIQGYQLPTSDNQQTPGQRFRPPGGKERAGEVVKEVERTGITRPTYTTDAWNKLISGTMPVIIYDWDAQNAGVDDTTMESMGYWKSPLTNNWILLGGSQTGGLKAPTYGDAYSGGFRGYGGGGRGGGGGTSYGGGYTGYGTGYNTNQAGQYTQADRLIREAAIGLISWRI